MAKVLIPTPLRQYSEKHDSVELTGTTVGEVLGALTTKYPDLRKQLFNERSICRRGRRWSPMPKPNFRTSAAER